MNYKEEYEGMKIQRDNILNALNETIDDLREENKELKIHNPNYTPVRTLKKTIEQLYKEQAKLVKENEQLKEQLSNSHQIRQNAIDTLNSYLNINTIIRDELLEILDGDNNG